MKTFELKRKKVEELKDIICDSCGKSCLIDTGLKFKNFEFMELKAEWRFGSKKDGEEWNAHLCEKCVDEKLSFIKFENKNYLPF